jgi:hypothetical protein
MLLLSDYTFPMCRPSAKAAPPTTAVFDDKAGLVLFSEEQVDPAPEPHPEHRSAFLTSPVVLNWKNCGQCCTICFLAWRMHARTLRHSCASVLYMEDDKGYT